MRINFKVYKENTLVKELGLSELLGLQGTCQFPLNLGDNLQVKIFKDDMPIEGTIKSCFFNLQEASSELINKLKDMDFEQVEIPCNTDQEAITATQLFWYIRIVNQEGGN